MNDVSRDPRLGPLELAQPVADNARTVLRPGQVVGWAGPAALAQPEPLDVERLRAIEAAARAVVASTNQSHDTMTAHDHAKCLPLALDILAARLSETPR